MYTYPPMLKEYNLKPHPSGEEEGEIEEGPVEVALFAVVRNPYDRVISEWKHKRCEDPINPWIKNHILEMLTGGKQNEREASSFVKQGVGHGYG